MRTRTLALTLLLACTATAAQEGEGGSDVIIYRCTGADGSLTLRDTPCDGAQAQQVRTMLRPKDAPPREPMSAQTPVLPAAEPAPQVVVVAPPQPMYECVTPDGERYTSDTGDGNPRLVPLWTLGYPSPIGGGGLPPPNDSANRARAGIAPPGMSTSPNANISVPSQPLRPPAPPPPRHPGRPGHPGHPGYDYGYGGGSTMVRDTCTRLPQGEVCARLRDRREEIRRRFFNAQERERNTLRVEERGLNARLANDCGIR